MSLRDHFNEEAGRLSDAIILSNTRGIRDSLKTLISHKCKVSITLKGFLLQCSTHDHLNSQSTPNRFSNDALILPFFCSHSHKVCYDCCKFFVNEYFPRLLFNNLYECPGCFYIGLQNSRLFDSERLENWLYFLLGEERINQAIQAINAVPLASGPPINYRKCSVNNCGDPNCSEICISGHLVCINHLVDWTKYLAQNNDHILCPVACCKSAIITSIIREALGNTYLLYPLKERLRAIGLDLSFCYNCWAVARFDLVRNYYGGDPMKEQTYTCMNCSACMCTSCGEMDHFGYTCFYAVANEEFKEIDLLPPQDPFHLNTALEREYVRAKYAFNEFIHPAEEVEFKQAKLFVNKTLEKRYAMKKQEMAMQCGGRDLVNELFIWHGSKAGNYINIMKTGLKVGGVDDGVGVDNGKVHGYGVYSATTPDTPKIYANDSQWIACFLALKGNESNKKIKDPGLLNNGRTHSYVPKGEGVKDWLVLFTKEQLLPRYLVEYKTKGK